MVPQGTREYKGSGTGRGTFPPPRGVKSRGTHPLNLGPVEALRPGQADRWLNAIKILKIAATGTRENPNPCPIPAPLKKVQESVIGIISGIFSPQQNGDPFNTTQGFP